MADKNVVRLDTPHHHRKRWLAAKAQLDEIDKEREAVVAPAREAYEATLNRMLAPTEQQFQAARLALTLIEEAAGEIVNACEGCGGPIFDGERYHVGVDVALCVDCAPTYGDMVDHPESFQTIDDDADDYRPMTPEEALAQADAHVAAGGHLTDRII